MLSRLSTVTRNGVLLHQIVKPCLLASGQRSFSVSSANDGKSAWNKTAWPAWQMYKDLGGSSGATMFQIGLVSYLLSKEIFIINDEVLLLFAMGFTGYQLSKAVGPTLAKMLDERRNDILDNLNKGKIAKISAMEAQIEAEESGAAILENRKEFFEIIKSNNEMRLDLEYRRRLNEVETEVKKRLDYQIDLQKLEQNIEEEHIASWVEKQVIGSISPKQESDAIAQCIRDLDALAATVKA